MRAVVIAAGIASGCSGGAPPAKTPPAPEPAPAPPDAAPAPDAPPSLDEAEARAILFDRFRRAGLRIRKDVRLERPAAEVTLDGFDPRAKVGYEYVAPTERDSVFDQGEREALERDPDLEVLILDATWRAHLEERADDFLGGLER